MLTEYYHHWAFLALSQGPACKSLFQELLLLLQPLNQFPFDLHLLSELRLLKRQAPKPSRSLTPSNDLFLQIPSNLKTDGHSHKPNLKEERQLHHRTHRVENLQSCAFRLCKQPELFSPEEKNEPKSVSLISSERECPGWWLGQTPVTEGVMVDVCCSHGQNEEVENFEIEKEGLLQASQRVKPQKELRWARLFGSDVGTLVASERAQQNNNQTKKTRSVPSTSWVYFSLSSVTLNKSTHHLHWWSSGGPDQCKTG